MFDHEIQAAPTEKLEAVLRAIGPYPQNAGAVDLGIRVAKELRYRNRYKKAADLRRPELGRLGLGLKMGR